MDELKIRMRAVQLEAMHTVILAANDENIYMRWILIVPDCPDREDFESIAETDEDYNEVCDLFIDLVKKEGYRV